MHRQRRVPPSSAFCSATACPVVPLPAKKSSTTTSSGMVARIRRISPVGFGDSKTWPTIVLELGDRGVGGPDLLGQPDRAQLLAPARRGVQPVLLEHVDPLAVPALDPAAHQVVGPLVDPRPAPAPHRRPTVAEHRRHLDRPVERRRRHPAGLRVAPDREVQGARGDRVELLVGVAQRQVPEPAAVRVGQREVALVDGVRAAGVEHALRRRRGRRRGGTRGWSRSPCRAGGPWR